MIAVDTNLLVYAHRRGAREHAAARRAIERAAGDPRGWGITFPSVAEFWAVVTHPASRGGASPPGTAARFLEALRSTADMQVWLPGEGMATHLASTATEMNVHATRIFDLQIALIAKQAGAEEIWTHDARFVRVPGIRLHDPIEPRR